MVMVMGRDYPRAAKAARKFTLEYGTGVERQAAKKPVKVEEKATGEVVIDTGAARFTLSAKKLLASVKLHITGDGDYYDIEAIDQTKPEVWAVDDKGIGNGVSIVIFAGDTTAGSGAGADIAFDSALRAAALTEKYLEQTR